METIGVDGGGGGSVTLLCRSERAAKRAMMREVESAAPRYKNIPTHLSRFGLRVWEGASQP